MKYRNQDWLRTKYIDEKLSAPQIAKLCGLKAPRAIYKFLKRFSIPIRTISEANKLRRHTPETRKKISESHQGKKLSAEHRRKLSLAHQGKYRGEEHPNWKGGRWATSAGYIMVYAPEHPGAYANRPYVFEHRLVVEKALGRLLKSSEQVHHINGDKADNRLENLQLINHHRQATCPRCGWPMGNVGDYIKHWAAMEELDG